MCKSKCKLIELTELIEETYRSIQTNSKAIKETKRSIKEIEFKISFRKSVSNLHSQNYE